MKSIKSLLIFISISVATLTASAANIKVYINPGHGSWGPNCRPQATIPYPALSSGRPDTLGFYESNTNLWKALALEEKLLAAGGFDVKLSRRANGPYPYAGYEDKTYNKALTQPYVPKLRHTMPIIISPFTPMQDLLEMPMVHPILPTIL